MEDLCSCEGDFGFEPLSVGDVVPEELDLVVFENNKIEAKTFRDYRGKWVILFFYPGDFTFICPTELAELASMYDKFTAEGAEIIGVSTDSAYVHKAWHDTSESIKTVQYPLASDQSHTLSALFGTLLPDDGVALRGTFLISPEGVIKTVEIHDNSVGRSAAETLRKLKAAKYVSEHPGNVCPASWQEGGETLTPGVDLVGKI